MHERLNSAKLIGLEPLTSARRAAAQRLARFAAEVKLLGSEGWSELSDACVDLVVGHEVLQYIGDVSGLMAEISRVLAPGRFAYLVLGCHTENPLWPEWKLELEELGHRVFDHAPLDLMAAGAHANLMPSVRPLRDTGWAFYDPSVPGSFTYPSVGTLLDHQFRHKLLFRFERRK